MVKEATQWVQVITTLTTLTSTPTSQAHKSKSQKKTQGSKPHLVRQMIHWDPGATVPHRWFQTINSKVGQVFSQLGQEVY